MNRAQRRKQEKSQRNKSHADRTKSVEGFPRKFPKPRTVPLSDEPAEAGEPDFSEVPLATICQSIQLLIDELRSRGYPMHDYDNKEKSIQLIQILQGKVFFMAAEEEKEHGEV